MSLYELEARLRSDFAMLNLPPANWVPPRPGVADVLVVGAGMLGLAASFALTRLGVLNHQVIDSAPAGREGPWVTYARMETLRSPKHLVGPGGDMATLSFRAWFTAQHGEDGWSALGKIPRATWQDYLGWFGRMVGAPLANGVAMTGLRPAAAGEIAVETSAGVVRARRVVLAMGRDGFGGPRIPDWVPRPRPAAIRHSSEAIDFAALKGRVVAVVGASASAVDNAATALEAGVAEAHLLVRRPAIPTLNRFKSMVHPGYTQGMPGLDDGTRLAFLHAANAGAVAPPRESLLRLARQPGFVLHLNAPVQGVDASDSGVTLRLPDGELRADMLILGTGFEVDLGARRELRALAEVASVWGPEGGEFAAHPRLGPGFEMQARADSAAAWLGHVAAFNIGAIASLGLVSGDIPGVAEGARRLAEAIARSLFVEDAATHLARLGAYAEPELLGDEVPASRRSSARAR